jgi:serine/threonine-protein kinase HipA
MPAPERSCFVYIQLPGTFETVTCARLTVAEVSTGVYEGTFQYGRRFLERKDVVALDAFHLGLTSRPLKFTKLKGVPGAVRDASPDAWGRRVIQAKLQRPEQDIQEMEYLLNGPDDGAGNLSFGTQVEPPKERRPFNRTHQLEALVAAAEKLEEDGRLPHEVLEKLEPGTSMGGARPKVTLEDGNKIWLAKLPEKGDRQNMQRIEYATLELARAAGLKVCGTRMESVGAKEALLLERFDREWAPEAKAHLRYGLVSGLTVLDAEDGYFGRERWSYPLLADELRRWSRKPDEDRLELYKRMLFNAMVTNNDDHPRNHAMLRTHEGWRLSPAYDIVPKPLLSLEQRDLALTVGKFGRSAGRYNLLSRCDAFGLDVAQARHELDSMLKVVQGWRDFYAERGVSKDDLEYLEQAILPQSFYRDAPPEPI